MPESLLMLLPWEHRRKPLLQMDTPQHGHVPVLLPQVIELLAPQPGDMVLDCTIGRGGHALAIAEKIGASGTLVGLDVDPDNLSFARQRLEKSGPVCRFFQANFARLSEVLAVAKIPALTVILADLGVSTNQILSSRHGLSFSHDGPLDMRLDPELDRTAADMVNHLPEKTLADVLYNNGDERYSRRIARTLVRARKTKAITTTAELAQLVRSCLPHARSGAIDPATRTFQALRIEVNHELENLTELLKAAPRWLRPGGRIGIISFHSGEDRLVKQAFRNWAADGRFNVLTPKPVVPTELEMASNPRSRSAKMRVARMRME
ncbi:MAG: 16S rRNA (cytosine(1402)-N(4))-methyltransferase RsmH [Planctomycetia bacterium]|nr:16S rRNA (cytosine(1402)-N(4))-methyltransferase RsmH [Planctomycetia bacterium]